MVQISQRICCGGFDFDETLKYENGLLSVNGQVDVPTEYTDTDGDSATLSATGMEVDDGVNVSWYGIFEATDGSTKHGFKSTDELTIDATGVSVVAPVYMTSPNGTVYKITMTNDGKFLIEQKDGE